MSDGAKLVLRIPTKKMHADLKRLAKAANRSLNQEILTALQDWIWWGSENNRPR